MTIQNMNWVNANLKRTNSLKDQSNYPAINTPEDKTWLPKGFKDLEILKKQIDHSKTKTQEDINGNTTIIFYDKKDNILCQKKYNNDSVEYSYQNIIDKSFENKTKDENLYHLYDYDNDHNIDELTIDQKRLVSTKDDSFFDEYYINDKLHCTIKNFFGIKIGFMQ